MKTFLPSKLSCAYLFSTIAFPFPPWKLPLHSFCPILFVKFFKIKFKTCDNKEDLLWIRMGKKRKKKVSVAKILTIFSRKKKKNLFSGNGGLFLKLATFKIAADTTIYTFKKEKRLLFKPTAKHKILCLFNDYLSIFTRFPQKRLPLKAFQTATNFHFRRLSLQNLKASL